MGKPEDEKGTVKPIQEPLTLNKAGPASRSVGESNTLVFYVNGKEVNNLT